MPTLTVNELLQYTTSCSSTTTKSTLTGKLSLVTEKNTEHKQGSIRLNDMNTRESIACVLDRFAPNFIENVVTVDVWNFIRDPQSGCLFLEILSDNTYREGSELSVIREHIVRENEAFDRMFNSREYHTPHSKLLSKNTDLVGKVKAISGLRISPNSPVTFLVELVNTEDNESIIINFTGEELIVFRFYFQIDSIYTFRGLVWAENLPYNYLYTNASKCCTITPTQYLNNITIIPHLYDSNLNMTRRANYKGQITRVIDTLFGIYEMDDQFILCLYNCPGYSIDTPYRVNTRLNIHNFHGAWIHSGKENSYLLQAWNKNSPCSVVEACQKTYVSIIEFPNHLDLVAENMGVMTNHSELYIECITNNSSFTQLAQQLELYESLNGRFDVDLTPKQFIDMFKAIRKYVFNNTNTEFDPGVGYLTSFIHHPEECSSIAPELSKHIYLDSYLTLKTLKTNLIEKLQPYELNMRGANNMFVLDNLPIRYSLYEQDRSYVLGLVEMTDDGRVMLRECGTDIELVTSTRLEFGGIYIIKQGMMFEEDLSFKEAITGVVKSSKLIYLTCDAQNMYLVRRPLIPRFHMQFQFDPYKITGFTCTNPDIRTYSVVHILEKNPIQTVLYDSQDNPNPQLCMESRLLVEIYPIGEQTSLRKAILVTSNRTNTLDYNKSCQVDGWCVISGLDQQQSNVIYMEKGKNHMFPISIQPTTAKSSISIVPVKVSTSRPKDESRRILRVSQLTIDALAPDDSYRKRSYLFYNFPVHVRGVVVSKKIMKGMGTAGVLEGQSREIHNLFGIGTGSFDRKVQIQLRQEDTLDSITIYIDPTKIHYPLGLVPGATVTFRNLLRKSKESDIGVICETLDTSFIQVETTRYEDPEIMNDGLNDDVTQKYINDLLVIDETMDQDEIFKVYCSVQKILNIEMKWSCRECYTDILKYQCQRMCTDSSRCFIVSAFMEIGDNNDVCLAAIDGMSLMSKILQLNEQQLKGLEQLALEYGRIQYNQFRGCRVDSVDIAGRMNANIFHVKQRSILGCTLTELFEKAKSTGDVWMYGKIMKPSVQKTIREDVNPELENIQEVSTTELGEHSKFYEFEKKKIKVLDILNADKKAYAYNELQKALRFL